jgi:hypothetical protein
MNRSLAPIIFPDFNPPDFDPPDFDPNYLIRIT